MNIHDICLFQKNPDLGMNTKLPEWIRQKKLCKENIQFAKEGQRIRATAPFLNRLTSSKFYESLCWEVIVSGTVRK